MSSQIATTGAQAPVYFHPDEITSLLGDVRSPLYVFHDQAAGRIGASASNTSQYPLIGSLPPLYPEWLGDRAFLEAHGVRFPYVQGAMARGIATEEMVIAMGNAGMLGFFGSAGLSVERITTALEKMSAALDPHALPWGVNLIHSPTEPQLEEGLTQLYIDRGVKRVSASAFLGLTENVVYFAFKGASRDGSGQVIRPRHIFAKVSRTSIARQFMSPAPKEIIDNLLKQGKLNESEAVIAASAPVAEDITVEADSGGHTDSQILGALFPLVIDLARELEAEFQLPTGYRIGAAGGLGTPGAVAAAFSMGASYVLTASVNQSAIEAGLCEKGKDLLEGMTTDDVMYAPCADMFEIGAKVQVLKKGSMYGPRAKKFYDLYLNYNSIEELPADVVSELETKVFRKPLGQVWEETSAFFAQRMPEELARAEKSPKHKMSLIFRSYLGQSSRWAITGQPDREIDFQIWCGPAQGAFNAWAKGSFLEKRANRSVVQIALNLLEGAAVVTRAQQLRSFGVAVSREAYDYRPISLALN